MEQRIPHDNRQPERTLGDGPTHSDNRVDVTLIRWMLSLSPGERLHVAQQWARDAVRLEKVSSIVCDCPLIIDDKALVKHSVRSDIDCP